MGTPSVLLKGSTASEVITDKKNGFLVENNPEEFVDLLLYLEKDREKARLAGENARSSLVRSWQDVVDEVIDRYDSLLKRYKNPSFNRI